MAKTVRIGPAHAPATVHANGTDDAAWIPDEPGPAGGIDVAEALRRIVVVHKGLLAVFVVLGLIAGYGIHLAQPLEYAASARIVLDTLNSAGPTDAQAIADGARAIATSRSHVAAALDSTNLKADPATVAAKDVAVDPVGTSGVLRLTVTYPEPKGAAALANALATDLVQTDLRLRSGGRESVAVQLSDIDAQIAQVDAQIKSAQEQLGGAAPADVPRITSLISSLISERTSLVQEETAVLSQRYPAVIDPARAPTAPASSNHLLATALGALLGIVTGVGLAALRETLRPNAASASGVAAALGAPLLGELARRPDDSDATVDAMLALRLRRLAARDGAATLELVPAVRPVDLHRLAYELQVLLEPPHQDGRPHRPGTPGVRAGTAPEVTALEGRPPTDGVVLVAPSVAPRRELERTGELLRLTGQRVVAVLAYRDRGPRRGRRSPQVAA